MKGRFVVREVKCGRVIERSKVFVPYAKAEKRHRVKGATSASRKDKNARQAVKVLARVLNCNYQAGDMLLSCKFDDKHLPKEPEQLGKILDNFCRRIIRELGKVGVDKKHIKRIIVESDKRSKDGTPARLHGHIVISGEGFSFREKEWWIGQRSLNDIWGLGTVYGEAMHAQDDYTPMAAYLLRQAMGGSDKKKYRCSRNMEKPIITEYTAVTDCQLKAPAGCVVVESQYDSMKGQNYIRYIAKARGHERC